MLGRPSRFDGEMDAQLAPCQCAAGLPFGPVSGAAAKAGPARPAAERIARYAKIRAVGRGEFLFLGRDAGTALHLLLEGVVGLYRDSRHGEAEVLGYRYPGDLIVPPREGLAWGFEAKALTPARHAALSLQQLRACCRREPALAGDVLALALGGLAEQPQRLRRHWRLGVRARLASFLLELGDRVGSTGEEGLSVPLPMLRTEIASYLGIRPETVSRIFGDWKARSLITLPSPRVVRIPDALALQADAGCAQPEGRNPP